MKAHGIAGNRELQRAAAQHELPHEHADGVFALAGPLDDGCDQSAAMPAHHGGRGLASRLAVSKDTAQIRVVEIGEILGEPSCGLSQKEFTLRALP